VTAWTRKEVIGDATLYLGDCREVLPTLGAVDALIWDPPWGIGFSEYNSHTDSEAEYPKWISNALDLSEKLVRDGWAVVFQGPRRASEWTNLIPRPWRVMACAKNFTQILPGKGPIWSTDFALFWPVGEPRVEHGRGRDFHLAITSDMRGRPKGHPCPRPLDQMQYVVTCFSEPGFVCLDPTMGSGTTGVACVREGRKFIGIEIDEGYFDIACKRIDAEVRAPRLNLPPPPKPVQGDLL
jgi:site-specific DNA-methyltransferase (adenine-specific)